ncbi:MAG: molybdopterin dehydrogenase FAD-binding [Peptococcaceae bacterium]|nr:molybdopterin dehydrogenase FAD-binding [Peptococcaceae bacterium]
MFTIQDYVVPGTLEEAYRILTAKRNNTILGGCGFLRLGSQRIGTAIDLTNLNLNFIEEYDQVIEIGAMTTFRDLETSPLLKGYFNGLLPQAVKHIVGVQLRNIVTVGGTVYSRYGFSDLITALLSLEAEVELFKTGRVSLENFLENASEKDILVKVIIPKTAKKAVFNSMRNSQSDYAIVNVAVSKEGDRWLLVAGARPHRAKIARKASLFLANSSLSSEDIEHAANLAISELTFGSNMRASQKYRETVCKVLLKRAIGEVLACK